MAPPPYALYTDDLSNLHTSTFQSTSINFLLLGKSKTDAVGT